MPRIVYQSFRVSLNANEEKKVVSAGETNRRHLEIKNTGAAVVNLGYEANAGAAGGWPLNPATAALQAEFVIHDGVYTPTGEIRAFSASAGEVAVIVGVEMED